MSETLEAAKSFLDEDGMRYTEAGGALYVPMHWDGGKWTARLCEVHECFVCSSGFPVNVPEPRRGAVAELLTRLNWALIVGNWELDMSDGEVRYKTSAPARHAPLPAAMVRDLCHTNFNTFTDGWPLVLDVAYAGSDPAEAIDAGRAKRRREREEFDALMEKCGFDPAERQGAAAADGKPADGTATEGGDDPDGPGPAAEPGESTGPTE